MKVKSQTIIAVLITAGLCAIYAALPYVGTVSLTNIALSILVSVFLFIVILCVLYRIAPTILTRIHCPKIENKIYTTWTNRRFVLILWGLLLICWLPTYLAFFPGIFGYDAPIQMQQLMGEAPFSAHHPILHTFILGGLMECGKNLSGSYSGGVALFCIIQGILVTGSISYCFLFMKIKRTPFPVLAITFLVCACNPVLQVLSFNITKDILFGVCFLHFILCCYKWLEKQEVHTKSEILLLVFWGIMSCLLRNQGKYIILVLLLLCLILYRTDRKLLLSLGTIIIVSQLFFAISTNVFGVKKTDEREMLSIPMQQMAFVCNQYMQQGDVNLTQEEFDKFTLLVNAEYLPNYRQDISDPVKSYFNTAVLKEDLPGYIKLYLSIGLKNPGYYLMAMRNMIYPYWNMTLSQFRYLCVENTFPHVSTKWGIQQTTLFPSYKEFLTDFILSTLGNKSSIITWLLQPGICIWILTALLGIAIVQNNKIILIGTSIPFLFFGTLLLGPVALFRYIYPLMLATPWATTLLCNSLESAKSNKP
ncbi:MAG: hypothetical protein IKK33_10100 [Lachnospiraceae bacterium]|nr:hypothetical protein [Lachnospiraceae bacterium]